MKSLSFVFKNIKTFFLHHTVMFFFLIIVQVICCISVFIVCGMANNMYYVEDTGNKATDDNIYFRGFSFYFDGSPEFGITHEYDSETGKEKTYYIVDNKLSEFLDYSACPTVAELRPSFDKLSSALGDDFAFANFHMAYNEKLYIKDIDKLPSAVTSIVPGNQPTALGEVFEHASGNIFSGDNKKYQEGDILTLNNIQYSYVSTRVGGCAIPYNSLQDNNFRVFGVSIVLTELPTPKRRTEIQNIINDIFDMNIYLAEVPDTYEPMERQISQMVYIISLVVMAIILFALAKFYSYVLSNRKNTLTVLRLCGGTKRQIHLIYMIEIFLTMIVTSALGFVVFKYLCYKPIAEMYPSFDVFFTPDVYITIIAAYIVLALIIMAITIIPATKASIIDMKRG
ncbi:MAG: FtsX-like permease family protein [Acutalibacteraceae bacterium]